MVTLRIARGLPSLRQRDVARAVRRAFVAGKERYGMRLCGWSLQDDHIHMIVEADDRDALTRGLKGLSVRVARALNRYWCRKGRVFGDRFHVLRLGTPTQVRNAWVYVLQNARKHGRWHRRRFDRFSSGFWFDGWITGPARRPGGPAPVASPKSWLLATGWRRLGPIGMEERPAGERDARLQADRAPRRRTARELAAVG